VVVVALVVVVVVAVISNMVTQIFYIYSYSRPFIIFSLDQYFSVQISVG